jgi:glycosyltransferase involved in cell wall biosynthesis
MAAGSSLHLAFVYPQLKRLTGAQRLILMLASTLVAGGDRVTLVTHRLAAACRAVLDERVEVIETGVRVDWTGRHHVDSALEYAQGARLVERLPSAPDAVVFFGPPSLPALAVARRRGRWPLVSFCYEPPRFAYADLELIAGRFGAAAPAARAAFRLYRPVDRWLLGQADLICANGRFGAGEVRRVYGRPALVVEHGVEMPAVDEAAALAVGRRYGLGDAPALLTVNHLHPRKRIDLYLATLAEVRRRRPDTLGVVAGVGADGLRLERVAGELGVADAVRWTGFVADDELAALYRRATVYVHTAQRESFGLSVLEATAAGLPVVAVDEGGPRDILDDGRLGRLCPANPAALADAVDTLLADPAAASDLGRRAAAAVQRRFRWERGASALADAVRGLRRGLSETAVVAAGDGAS